MDWLACWDWARVGRRLAGVAAAAIGFFGWFALVLSGGAPGTTIIVELLGPLAIGAVGAAIGRGHHLGWLLLGFALPPTLAVISARLSQPVPENSGFAFVEYSILGLVLVTLGFYGWLAVRRIWTTRRRQAARDIRER
jgi:hypothetical protein